MNSKRARSKTMSFRIGAALATEVERKAIEGGFQSSHQYVREICLSALAEQGVRDEVARFQEGLNDIAVELTELRYDVRVLCSKLLALLIDISFDEAEHLLGDELVEDDPERINNSPLDESDWRE